MIINKGIVAGVSLILVVGVVVGLVAGIRRVGHDSNNETVINTDDSNLSSGMKIAKTICEPTDYKDACIRTISGVANNETATPKDFINAAISATIDEVRLALDKSSNLGKDTNNITHKNALEGCNQLLQYAINELQLSMSMVNENELKTIDERVYELNNWLSAVISYQQTCLYLFDDYPELKSAMENGLSNGTDLTCNAVVIVTKISHILTALNIPPLNNNNNPPNSRRLLEAKEATQQLDNEVYPKWFSAANRKLLAVLGSGQLEPNAVVAKDGSGKFKTITEALAAYPKNNDKGQRFVIYVKAGLYEEHVTVSQDLVNVFMYGDGPGKTIVTGRRNKAEGLDIVQSATFVAVGNGFIAKGMTFENTAGPKAGQAPALQVGSDMSAFFQCNMEGYQDTLWVQVHRQFYSNCKIYGTVDFIFGESTTVIQNSEIIVRRPIQGQENMITAQGRVKDYLETGLVIQNCRIVPDPTLFPDRLKIPTYLGRPWGECSRTVIMESVLDDFIQPAGWSTWKYGDSLATLDTSYYAEYANIGPGARTDRRVQTKGFHVITDRGEAAKFTAGTFIQGGLWLNGTGVPYSLGLTR